MLEKGIKITVGTVDAQIMANTEVGLPDTMSMGELAMLLLEIEKVKRAVIKKAESIPPVIKSKFNR